MVLFYFVRWGRSRPWSRWGHIDGVSHLGGCAYSAGRFYFYRQGLKSGGVRPILGRRRPGGPERAEIRRNMHFPSSNRGEQNVYFLGMALAFRPGLRITAGPAWYPREVLRGERPKRFFPPFLIGEKWGISGASPAGALVSADEIGEGQVILNKNDNEWILNPNNCVLFAQKQVTEIWCGCG